MTQDELKLVLEALETPSPMGQYKAITAIKEALAQTQEPVAWLLTDKNINSIQVDSIKRLIDRFKHAHHTDIRVRINGQDEWFEADWLKHMVRVSPPQRTWVGLTTEERNDCLVSADPCEALAEPEAEQLMEDIEAKLKQKNGYAEEENT